MGSVDIGSLLQRLQTQPSQVPQDPSGGNPYQNQQILGDKSIDFARPFVGNAIGDLAGVAGSALGPAGALAANNLGYAATDTALQQLKSKHGTLGESFGEAELNAIVNAVGGKIISSVFKGAQALRSADQPEIYKYFPKSSQALEAHGYHTLASAANVLENMAPNANSAALDKSGGAGFTQALRFVNQINGRQAGTNVNVGKIADQLKAALTDGVEPVESEYTPIKIKQNTADYQPIDIDLKSKEFPSKGTKTQVTGPVQQTDVPGSYQTQVTGPNGVTKLPEKQWTVSQDVANAFQNGKNTFQVLDDAVAPGNVDKLSKILIAGQANGQTGLNVKQDLQAYQFMKMIQDGAKYDDAGNFTRFNPDKIKNIWNDPDMQQSLNVLYGKQGKQDTTDFLQNIFKTQSSDAGASTTAQYMKNRSLWATTGGFVFGGGLLGALTGHLSGELAGLGGLTGLYLGANQLGRLLTKPSTARALVSLAGGESLSDSKQFIAKQIMNSLQGSSIALMGSDGKKTWGSVVRGPDGSLQFQER